MAINSLERFGHVLELRTTDRSFAPTSFRAGMCPKRKEAAIRYYEGLGFTLCKPKNSPDELQKAIKVYLDANNAKQRAIHLASGFVPSLPSNKDALKGGFSTIVYEQGCLQDYIDSSWSEREGAYMCGGYIGNSNRRVGFDPILEDFLRNMIGWTDSQIASWLTSTGGRHMADSFEDADSLVHNVFKGYSVDPPKCFKDKADKREKVCRLYQPRLTAVIDALDKDAILSARGGVFCNTDEVQPQGGFSDSFWAYFMGAASSSTYLQHPSRLKWHDQYIVSVMAQKGWSEEDINAAMQRLGEKGRMGSGLALAFQT